MRGMVMDTPAGTVQLPSGAIGKHISVQLPTGLITAFVESTATLFRGDTLMFSVISPAIGTLPPHLRTYGVPMMEHTAPDDQILRMLGLAPSALRARIMTELRSHISVMTADMMRSMESALLRLAEQPALPSSLSGSQRHSFFTDTLAQQIAILHHIQELHLPVEHHWYDIMRPVVLQEKPDTAWNTLRTTQHTIPPTSVPTMDSISALLADTEQTMAQLWSTVAERLKGTSSLTPESHTQSLALPPLSEQISAQSSLPFEHRTQTANTTGTGGVIEQLQSLRNLIQQELSLQSGQQSGTAPASLAMLGEMQSATDELLNHFAGQQLHNAIVMERGGTMQFSLFLPTLVPSSHRTPTIAEHSSAVSALVEIDVDDPRKPAHSSAVNFRVQTDMSALGPITVQGTAYQSLLMLTVYVAEPNILSFVSERQALLVDILRDAGYTVNGITVRHMEERTTAVRIISDMKQTFNTII